MGSTMEEKADTKAKGGPHLGTGAKEKLMT